MEAWDGMTPLHLACEGGLDNVLQTLVEHKVNVNSKVCHRLKKEKKETILQCDCLSGQKGQFPGWKFSISLLSFS